MASIGLYDPRTMFAVVERMPPIHTFFRSTFFKDKKTFYTETVDVDYKKGGRQLAPFVHPDIGGKTMLNKGFQTKTYKPPLLAPNKVTNADRLMQRSPGEHIYSGRRPAERAVQLLGEDFAELQETIIRREEWMAAQAILTGTIPIIGEGVRETIVFNFTNYEDFAKAGPEWTKGKLEYIDAKHKHVQKHGFVNCDICLMADDVAWDFINDAKVQKLLDTQHIDLATIAPKMLPNGVTYLGTYRKTNISFYSYNEWFLDDWTDPDNPVEKPLVPDGTFLLISTNAKYSMYYGGMNFLDDKGKWHTVEADKAPQSWTMRKPDRRFIQLSSRPIPVPHEVDSWFVSQVLNS